jgi:hypothetical protein
MTQWTRLTTHNYVQDTRVPGGWRPKLNGEDGVAREFWSNGLESTFQRPLGIQDAAGREYAPGSRTNIGGPSPSVMTPAVASPATIHIQATASTGGTVVVGASRGDNPAVSARVNTDDTGSAVPAAATPDRTVYRPAAGQPAPSERDQMRAGVLAAAAAATARGGGKGSLTGGTTQPTTVTGRAKIMAEHYIERGEWESTSLSRVPLRAKKTVSHLQPEVVSVSL